MPLGGGGGGGGPSTATSYQTNLPEYARPYVESMLGSTMQQLFKVKETPEGVKSIEEFRPYEPYSGQKVASFSPLQRKAQEQAFLLEPSSDYSTGSRMAFRAGDEAFDRSRYNVGQFGNQFQAPGAYVPGQFDAQQVQAPGLTQYQMAAPERVSAAQVGTPTMAAAQTGYDPKLTAFQMAAPERVGTESFTQPGTAERYMSPYMEQAIAPQLREARRASDIQAAQIGAEAAKQGAFGGGRAAILEAERRRNLATQTGDIRARGLQQAYDQAQQLYGTEQQRAMQAQLANQQAGLTAGGQNLAAQLGVQQLGAQTGLQTALANLSSQQQANVQNQAAQLQAQGLNAQQALQTALANQQAGLTAGQTNLQALLGTQQLGAGQSLQAQLANQQAMQQAQQLREQSRQFGAGQGLQAAGLGAQYGLAAQQLGEQSRQYGAGLGLQGLQTAQQSAGLLGQLAQQRFAEKQGVLGLQSQLGAQQQALEQQRISQAMQDYATAQQYPLMQLGFMSNMLRGLPMQAVNTQQYMAQPSYLTQGLGALGAGASIYNAFGRGQKEGGQVKGYDVGGEVREDLEQMDNTALQRYIKESQSETAKRIAQRILRERGPGMAGGGIVAFAKGSDGPVTGLPGSLMGLELGEESIAAEQATPEQIREMSTRELQEYNRTGKIPERLVDLPQEDVARAIDRQMAPAVGRGIGAEPKTDMAGARPPAAPAAAPAAPAAASAAPARAGLRLEDFMDQDAQTPQGLLDLQQQSDEAKSLARKTQAEHLADIRKEYGNLASSKVRQDYRQKVMEERANAKDEARRNRDLLMAQMFADMATRPGPVLVAMMGSVKDRLPDVIANEKDLKKAQREMDRVVFELDEATRLEERGLADKAYARKEDALKRVNDLSVKYATQSVELEKSREASRAAGRRAFHQERGATERTQMEVGARERSTEATERMRTQQQLEANVRAAAADLQRAEAALTDRLNKNSDYIQATKFASMPIAADSTQQMKDMQSMGAQAKKRMEDEMKRSLGEYRSRLRAAEARAAGRSPEEAKTADPLGLLGD